MKKYSLFLSFLGFHLFIVVLGAFVIPFLKIKNNSIDYFIEIYSSWTGGGHGYSFFSPDVGYQNAAKAYVLLQNDSLVVEAFGGNQNHLEARIGSFIHSSYNIKVYELNSRLLAAYVFGIYPDAKVVEISLGKFVIPDVHQYQTDPDAKFVEYYQGIYNRTQNE